MDAHFYPLTDGAIVCVRVAGAVLDESAAPSPTMPGAVFAAPNPDGCIARGTVDQRAEIRDGRWQRMLSGVPLRAKTSYEVLIAWDPTCAGFVAADALLVESDRLYHGNGAPAKQVVVGAMDARVVLKDTL